MVTIMTLVLATSLALLVLHFVVYPLVLWALRAACGRRPAKTTTAAPGPVSVVIAAHDEAPVIAARLLNVLEQSLSPLDVILVSDGSRDDTATRARALGDPRIKVIELPKRRGKANALNAGATAARGDIVVFSDANAIFAPDAIENLVSAFTDPTVGVASGDITTKCEVGTATGAIGATEGLYWRYEACIRKLESDLGSTVAVVGPLLAVRRDALTLLPRDMVNDDAWRALAALKAGWRVVYVPEARCRRRPSADSRQELERRKRIAAGRYQQLSRPALWPVNRPFVMAAWLAHKVLRLVAPVFLAAALASNIALVALSPGLLSEALLAAQAAFYLLGLVGLSAPGVGGVWRLPVAAAAFLRVMAGNLGGLFRYLSGGQSVLWAKASRAEG